MRKILMKIFSMLFISCTLFSTNAFAGTWTPHEGYNGVAVSWEYYNDDGSMPIEWKYIDGYWYYFEDGITRTAPLKENGKCYYFNSDAQLLTNQYVKVGSGKYGFWYWADSSGAINYDYSWLPENLS
ncbi:hypothetical protein U728_1058 [Clostridium botulinum 202F]|nr:hypothetical protein U728_1058 [Clostridium botulinum 202F]KAI3345959.1 hypothetical protein CIT17_10265 [Clostridium botulinum]MBY6987840.1 hypothetical protein [Clostridium botulinum]NFH02209.1 hypothetical protein [Clostridium botulinum]NFI56096.1 hypothetical protein [Clostridium botulinum]